MFTTPEQFAAANKATVDSLLSLANTALASAERIAALNLNTARSMMDDAVALSQSMLAVRDPKALVELQLATITPSLARMIARRVSSRTDSVGSPFNRRDTVACENPVRFAISLMVAIAPSPSHGCLIRF